MPQSRFRDWALGFLVGALVMYGVVRSQRYYENRQSVRRTANNMVHAYEHYPNTPGFKDSVLEFYHENATLLGSETTAFMKKVEAEK